MKDILILGSQADDSIFIDSKYDVFNVEAHHYSKENEISKVLEKDNLACVVFTGGSDVHPMFYGERMGPSTYCNLQRDLAEKEMFDYCMSQGIPMIGICRGAQLFNIMLGGKMVQDIPNHHGSHLIKTDDGTELYVNSIHHQAMIPSDRVKVIATSDGDGVPEVIVNEEHRILGVQFHPEMLSSAHVASKYFQSLIQKYDIVG